MARVVAGDQGERRLAGGGVIDLEALRASGSRAISSATSASSSTRRIGAGAGSLPGPGSAPPGPGPPAAIGSVTVKVAPPPGRLPPMRRRAR
jgi:hypothetical protein